MQKPLVSVIMPVFNREQYVAEAIESVLSQDYRPLELIVVDDGSTDGSAAIIKEYRPDVRYVYQANGGTSSARNKGLALAAGSHLAFLDSDDVWMPGKLAKQQAVFESNPDMDVVFGYAEQFFSPEVDDEFRKKIQLKEMKFPAQLCSAMLISREAFDRVGVFNEELRVGNVMEWYSRLIELDMNVSMLPDVVYRRRIHYSNLNVDFQDAVSVRLHALKAIIDRRRQVD